MTSRPERSEEPVPTGRDFETKSQGDSQRPASNSPPAASQLPTLLTQLLLTAASAWFVSVPQRDIGLWSLDFYKAGIRATEGRTEAPAQNDPQLAAAYLASARRNLETAYAYVPTNAEIAFALGNAWYYSHDNPRAQLCFERAVQISTAAGRPHDGALNNLGVIALSEKRPRNAEVFFQRSLRTEPDDPKTWALLAEACRDQGDIPHAEIAIAQAIKLNSHNTAFQKFRDDLRKPVPPPAPSPAPAPK